MNKRFFLSFLFLMVLLTQFSTVFASNSVELLTSGLKEYYTGNYKEAISIFNNLIQKSNQYDIDALYYQTLAYIEENNIVKAKENISKLEQRGYQFGLIHWKLGEVYLNEKSQFDSPFYNEAKKELEKANMLGINSPEFHSDMAMAYQGLGDLNNAAREYEKALASEGKLGDYINLATLYREQGKFDKAISAYNRALSISPDNTSIYLNMGSIYLEKKEYRSAIDILKKGVEINPSFVPIRYTLGEAYYLNNEIEKAETEFKQVVDSNPNSYRAYYYLGRIYGSKEDWQQAIYYFDKAIDYNPDYVRAYLALGDIYLKEDNAYKAIAQYTTAIEKNPTYAESHFHLAIAYYELGMKEAAIAELRKTIHLDSDNEMAKKLLDKIREE